MISGMTIDFNPARMSQMFIGHVRYRMLGRGVWGKIFRPDVTRAVEPRLQMQGSLCNSDIEAMIDI